MSTPNNNGSPQKVAVDTGVLEAYAADGFLTEDGAKDTAKVRQHVFEVVRTHKVLAWNEREAKAISRGAVVTEVFPNLAGPDQFSEAEDPQLARAIWLRIYQDLWSHLQPGASGAVQQLVGQAMGNGYVLVRTKTGADGIDAVYVTDNRTCIERDLLAPESASLQRKFDAVIATRGMLIHRQPDNAKRYAARFDHQVKALGAAGHDQLALAVEASVNGDAADEDESETDDTRESA